MLCHDATGQARLARRAARRRRHFGRNIGDVGFDWAQADTTLSYGQTYHILGHILGWTVLPSSDGTRFTNQRGHRSRHGCQHGERFLILTDDRAT
jgi:hypothetical protein